MSPRKYALLFLLVTGVAVYSQTPQKPVEQGPEGDVKFSSNTQTVIAPVLVTDRAGNIIDGLRPNQFHLFDNNKEQNIQVDVSFQPISLVIAIEASDKVESILPQIKHMGSLTPMLIGEQGEAAVVAFDSRVKVLQDFTNDGDKIKAAITKINAGNSQDRMIDAVEKGTMMLRGRPKANRKIILLISETRDQGSEARVRETLINAQLNNILIYCVDITQVAIRLTQKQDQPRPDPILPSMRSLPMGVPSTPTTVARENNVGNQAQFIPVLKEIYKGVKLIFVDNPNKVFAKGTGGGEFTFLKTRGLEDIVQRIGQEIHSQYIITYTPNNQDEGGFHELEVTTDRADLIAKTRPGYFIAGGKK